jgi:hypothetical protein
MEKLKNGLVHTLSSLSGMEREVRDYFQKESLLWKQIVAEILPVFGAESPYIVDAWSQSE